MDVINKLYGDKEFSLTHKMGDRLVQKIPNNIPCILSSLIRTVISVVSIPFHAIEFTALLIMAPFAALITYFRSVFVDKTIHFLDNFTLYLIRVGFAVVAIFANFANECL